jgi:hypothetical protein
MAKITDGDAAGTYVVSTWRRRGTDEWSSMPARCSANVTARHRSTWPSFHRCRGATDGLRR